MWEVEYTDHFGAWGDILSDDEQETIDATVSALQYHGPALGRPFVDTFRTSRHPNLKELRPRRGNIRVLFAFDPRRTAILLLGGDKTGRWQEWYRRMIPVADRLYDEHLTALREEGEIP